MLFDQIKTPRGIRMFYESGNPVTGSREARHFFERSTMRFFGDTMRSYGITRLDGSLYLYRKATAIVNVFGRSTEAGREFFGAWRLDPKTYDLDGANRETKERLWRHLYQRRKPHSETRALKHWKVKR